jgi:hypothetical protein
VSSRFIAHSDYLQTGRSPYTQKRVDALLALAEQAMSTMGEGLQPLSSSDKYQVVIHIERSNEEHFSFESGASKKGFGCYLMSWFVNRR